MNLCDSFTIYGETGLDPSSQPPTPPGRFSPLLPVCCHRPYTGGSGFPECNSVSEGEGSQPFPFSTFFVLLNLFSIPQQRHKIQVIMGVVCLSSKVYPFTTFLALVGVCFGGSDGPRGVAVGFVFDPKASCDQPCEHGGLCIRNNTCFCSKGYDGETCKYANCYPKCKNGGSCLRPGKCRCPSGFGGRYCHKVMCDGGCWNGGECTAVNGVAKCMCPSSWTGSKCQDAICPQGCKNGGICVVPGICSCPEGWLGGACHHAVCTQPCLNGGKCISPNKCRCRPPFSGPQCEKKQSH